MKKLTEMYNEIINEKREICQICKQNVSRRSCYLCGIYVCNDCSVVYHSNELGQGPKLCLKCAVESDKHENAGGFDYRTATKYTYTTVNGDEITINPTNYQIIKRI